MRHFLAYILISFLSVGMLQAQSKSEKVREIKVAYFNDKLDLKKSESQKFWKIYNQYESERRELLKRAKRPSHKKISEMSDAEIYKYVDYAFASKKKEVELQEKYFKQLRKILPAHKIVQLLRLEEQFRQYLFKQMRNKKKN